ncbi:hypothetical protein DXG03_003487 [Asterophora parasitica]|uniref:Peptidase A1 domain-containing protein n=1 Tax=Asterophora parasitica TaxID=117018 RepID=A0A9P7GG94_9AGAR|nr:hypothetical protein DXG03_003487 [Asterophora parasitica]
MRRSFRAYEINTGFPHPSDNTRHHKKYRRDTGSEELIDDDGALWHGAISVGTPPVSFTGSSAGHNLVGMSSSDLFLPGTLCKVNCDGHVLYDTNASSTAISLNDTFRLSFGDGSSVYGDQFTDTAVNQTVGAATNYSTGFSIDQFPPDGLLGMAFPEISVFGAEPFFHTLVAQNTTTAPQFSFKLAQNGSELFIGGVNTDLFIGPLTETPVVDTGFWQVALDAVNVNGRATSRNLSAIIDTGTTLVLGDFASVVKVYDNIPGAKNATNTIGEGFFTCARSTFSS